MDTMHWVEAECSEVEAECFGVEAECSGVEAECFRNVVSELFLTFQQELDRLKHSTACPIRTQEISLSSRTSKVDSRRLRFVWTIVLRSAASEKVARISANEARPRWPSVGVRSSRSSFSVTVTSSRFCSFGMLPCIAESTWHFWVWPVFCYTLVSHFIRWMKIMPCT